MEKTCALDGCTKRLHRGQRICSMHRMRMRTRGTYDPPLRLTSEEMFWRKVQHGGLNTCWLWQGHTAAGYGRHNIRGLSPVAHRAAYELLIGPIPDGLDLDHLCRVPACVNPRHLEPVTKSENSRRQALALNREHCVNGHAWTPENTYSSRGHRECRTCHRESERRRAGWDDPTQDKAPAARCGNGHEWTAENTYRRPDTGARMCRACMRESNRRGYTRRRAA